jgi:hypothetical protein
MSVCEQLLLYPLDTLKTNLQADRAKAVSPLKLARELISGKSGVRTLYRGFLAANVGTAPATVAYLTIYNELKGLGQSWCHSRNMNPLVTTVGVPFLAGAAADLSSLVLYTPFDVVTTHMQRGESQATYKGNMPAIVRAIYAQEGKRGFFRGFAAAALTYTPTSAIWWPSYEIFKRTLGPVLLDKNELIELNESLATDADRVNSSTLNTSASRRLAVVVAVSGVLAGALSYGLTNPFDLVRTRMVLQQQMYGEVRVLSVLRAVVRNEGFLALFKGVLPRVLSAAPASAIGSFTYELALRLSLKKEQQ